MKIIKTETESLKFNKVEVRTPTVGDLLRAERVSGKAEGMEFLTALLSQVATFDGKKFPPEELEKVSVADFLALSRELDVVVEEFQKPSSSL